MLQDKPVRREALLNSLRETFDYSSAEKESGERFRRAFYPVAEHLRVFAPGINLIIGYHGAGKSMLFKAAVEYQLSSEEIRRALEQWLFTYSLPQDRSTWRAGYPLGADFPDPGTLRRFIATLSDQTDISLTLADLWLAYLARVLCDQPELGGVVEVLKPAGVEVEAVYAAARHHRQVLVQALDELDARLKAEERMLFISYDELDTLGGVSWEVMAALLRGLLTLWVEHMRRWQHLQPKIFIRTDLFKNPHIFAADFAKLANSRAELTWSDYNLYAMLIKRIANISGDWLDYCKAAGLSFRQDNQFGWMPHSLKLEDARRLIEQIVGPFMGSAIKKGRTFSWVIDHLRDGLGRVTPRALVSLWGYAARQELESQRATNSQLIHPTSLRQALDWVSTDHVRMLESREMPWLQGVRQRLANREVPLGRQEWVDLLNSDWDRWRDNERLRPPHETPEALLDYMIEIGVCRKRADERIDVPDLFLYGLGVKRRGGVQR